MFDPAQLIFTPAQGMTDSEWQQLANNCLQAQLMIQAFTEDEVTESDLEDALDFFGVDVPQFAQTVNQNLYLLGF